MVLPDFPPGSGDPKELALEALAQVLGIDKSLIVLSDSTRRAMSVSFQIRASPEEIDRVQAQLENPDSLAG